ncbi:MAG: hypothetical protein K2X82_12080 [Gemmataceae bacterium]|nr:hypothetical protein [Gemmataceae bacterium]
MEPSIFLDFNLPNAATWFYFSVILTVTLFFQFTGVLSVRNLDLLSLFLLAPGFLLLQEANALAAAGDDARAGRGRALAYGWLLAGSGYWFVRAVVDLALVRRPVLRPNLTAPGLGFLGVALFVCLTAVAVRRGGEAVVPGPVGTRPIPIEQVKNGMEVVARQTQTAPPGDARFWVERSLAMGCHLAVVLGLLLIGWRHFGDPTAGMAAGTLYLLLPYTAFHIGQFHLAWPAAFVTWAVYCYRRPVLAGWLLGIAAGTAFVPLLLLPLWVSFYAGRGAGRFAGAFTAALGVSVGVMAAALWWDGWLTSGLTLAAATDWLPWRQPAAEGLWAGVHGAYRLPVFLVYLAFALGLAVWPSPKTLSHLIALSAAVLLGVQFWHPDRGGVYVLWYLPLVLLIVFRPTLAGLQPPLVVPGDGRMWRWAGAAWRQVRPARGTDGAKELAV